MIIRQSSATPPTRRREIQQEYIERRGAEEENRTSAQVGARTREHFVHGGAVGAVERAQVRVDDARDGGGRERAEHGGHVARVLRGRLPDAPLEEHAHAAPLTQRAAQVRHLVLYAAGHDTHRTSICCTVPILASRKFRLKSHLLINKADNNKLYLRSILISTVQVAGAVGARDRGGSGRASRPVGGARS